MKGLYQVRFLDEHDRPMDIGFAMLIDSEYKRGDIAEDFRGVKVMVLGKAW